MGGVRVALKVTVHTLLMGALSCCMFCSAYSTHATLCPPFGPIRATGACNDWGTEGPVRWNAFLQFDWSGLHCGFKPLPTLQFDCSFSCRL